MAGRRLKRALAAMAASVALTAGAADDALWYLQVDNDVIYHTDRWYTSGLRIARTAPSGDHETEWGILQEIDTPETKRANPIDRPNAARLLATYARHDRAPGDWRTLELDLGVTGPSALGRQAQDLAHRFVTAPHEEWKNQRSDRVDGQVAWVRSADLLEGLPHEARVRAHFGAVAGNQLGFAHAGLELRLGRGAAADISTPAMRFAATPPIAAADDSWSGFVGASVRAVGWNHLLDFAPGLDNPPAEREPFVERFTVGLTAAGRFATLAFALVHDTREFHGQRRGQDFGSLTVHVPF